MPTALLQLCYVKLYVLSLCSYLTCSSIETWVRVTFVHVYLTVFASVSSNAVAAIVIDEVLRV